MSVKEFKDRWEGRESGVEAGCRGQTAGAHERRVPSRAPADWTAGFLSTTDQGPNYSVLCAAHPPEARTSCARLSSGH